MPSVMPSANAKRKILQTGLIVIAAMGLYPPWVHIKPGYRLRAEQRWYAYGWIFDPPRPMREVQVQGALDLAMEFPEAYPVRSEDLENSIRMEMGEPPLRSGELPSSQERPAQAPTTQEPQRVLPPLPDTGQAVEPRPRREFLPPPPPDEDLTDKFIAKNIAQYPKLARIRFASLKDAQAKKLVPGEYSHIGLDGFTLPDGRRLPRKMEMEVDTDWTTRLDTGRLFIQWVIVCTIVGFLLITEVHMPLLVVSLLAGTAWSQTAPQRCDEPCSALLQELHWRHDSHELLLKGEGVIRTSQPVPTRLHADVNRGICWKHQRSRFWASIRLRMSTGFPSRRQSRSRISINSC